jgi:hypothetical protein
MSLAERDLQEILGPGLTNIMDMFGRRPRTSI